MSGKDIRNAIIVGLAMFSIYFGAGNLIFPPHIGLLSGENWVMGLVGLIITGIALPILAVVAVSNAGGFHHISRPVARWFYFLFNIVMMYSIGLLITIPRTGAMAYESGTRILASGVDGDVLRIGTIVVYFVITAFFAINRSEVVDKLGKYLTPILISLLIGIVLLGIFNPLGTPSGGIDNAFYNAFITSYQTGDVGTGLLTAAVFIVALYQRGYKEPRANMRMVAASCFVAFLGLLFVYGGLEYVGATASGLFSADITETELLVGVIDGVGGSMATYALAVAVVLACLTTAIGICCVIAGFTEELTRGRIPYKVAVPLVCLIWTFQAMGGVSYIIAMAGPILLGIYPTMILLVVFGLFARVIPNDGIWKGAFLLVGIVSIYEAIASVVGDTMPLQAVYGAIPLADQGFAWLLPGVVGAVLGGVYWVVTKRSSPGTEAIREAAHGKVERQWA